MMEVKKTKKADLSLRRGVYFNIGLIAALSLAISAFEWKTYGDVDFVDLTTTTSKFDPLIHIPPTVHKVPKPPKPKAIVIVEKSDDEELDDIDISDLIPDIDAPISYDVPVAPPIEKPEEPKDFVVVEKMPEFEGGQVGFMKHISKKINYPRQARNMGVEGKVFVRFVIDETGQIVDVEVIKGIGAGCDEEALRVINNAPKWTPGKQRGKPVRVKMVLPINFTLG